MQQPPAMAAKCRLRSPRKKGADSMFIKQPIAPNCWLALGVSAVLFWNGGCGDSGPQRAPIKGKITIAGQPLAAGQILFVPIAPTVGPATSAAIKNGEFALKKNQGPIVGTHRV